MIEWSDNDIAIRDAIRSFIDKEVRPHLDELETGELSPYPLVRKFFAEFGIDVMASEALKNLLEHERTRESKPKDADKRKPRKPVTTNGMESMGAIAVSELSGVSLGTVASIGVSLALGAGTIAAKGSTAQKERWLPKLVTCEHIAAWAITEPDSGSDAFGGMNTTVSRDGDDYILKGQKTFITNGPDADVLVVYAKLDEGDGTPIRDRKVLTFVLDKGMRGLVQGKAFKKMGLMSSRTGELFFDDVRLTPDRLLGETENHTSGDGRESARANFVAERVGVAVLALGIINECLRLSVDYARTRTLWDKPIGDLQLIQLKLAEMEVARINVQNMVFSCLEHVRETGSRRCRKLLR